MTNPIIFDGETHRPMTTTEFAQWEKDNIELETQINTQAQTLATKTAARQAVLDKLGLTQDEANALLG